MNSSTSTPVSPAVESGPSNPPQRPPIKIKIVSWNLGDSLPKGDLSPLFGEFPPYEPPDHLPLDFPDFGTEDGHPYHIIVVANQEAPTQSGVPRGLGGGITKGLAGQKEKEKLKERGKLQGQKEAEKAKKDALAGGVASAGGVGALGLGMLDVPPLTTGKEEFSKQVDVDPSVLSPTYTPHHGHHTVHMNMGTNKGWSDILEDYLSHGIQQAVQTNGRNRGTSRSSRDYKDLPKLNFLSTSGSESPEVSSPATMTRQELPAVPSKTPNGLVPPPLVNRSSSAPPDHPSLAKEQQPDGSNKNGNGTSEFTAIITPCTPDPIASPRSERAHMLGSSIDRTHNASPLSMFSMSSESTAPTMSRSTIPVPMSPGSSGEDKDKDKEPEKGKEDKTKDKDVKRSSSLLSTPLLRKRDSAKRLPPISIPSSHISANSLQSAVSTPSGNVPEVGLGQKRRGAGPYQFLVKERLLGLYLAIFVHKDCASWVEGYDHDFVPTGLMGGRMGNKGAIGISLKMAGHRFLFVCAHLAAHASHMDARINNVDKIKTELARGLDCFLSPEELAIKAPPGGTVEDLDVTDKFDTTFWFGDLNFRLEVSRLHADWLVKHKEYEKALEFDQLRNAMREGKVFDGFVEGDIDFAPTFKYDVWHSAKKMRKRGELQARDKNVLPGVEEAGQGEEDEDDSPTDDQASFVSTTTMTMDRRCSVDSNMWLAGQIDEEDEDEDGDSMSGVRTVSQPVRPIAAIAKTGAIKVKHRFMKIMKSASQSPVSSSPVMTPRSQSPTRSMETASFSQKNSDSISQQPSRLSMESTRPSIDSETSRPGLTRQISKNLKRRLSGRVAQLEDSASSSEEDTREGVYDTSSKQRVPSWCDRVLWKTHVEQDIGPQPRQFEVLSGQARFKLFGHAIAQKFHRKTRDARDRGDQLQTRFTRMMADNHGPYMHALPPPTTVTTPILANRDSLVDGDVDTPRASVFSTKTVVPDARSPSPTDAIMGSPRPRPQSVTMVESLGAMRGDGKVESPMGITLGAPIVSEPKVALISAQSEKPESPHRHHSGLDAYYPHRKEQSSQSVPRSRTISGLPPHDPTQHDFLGETSLASARRWFSNLPGILLHPRGSIDQHYVAPEEPVVAPEPEPEPVVRRRKGEVDCLEYTTIDDVGMRRLEGRSDHRPIIFAAAVYT